jgi:hypothetical protein
MQLWKLLPLAFLLAACATAPTEQTSATTDAGTGAGSKTLPTIQTGSVTPVVSVPSTTNGSAPFTLTILSPADQAVVSQPSVEIRGQVSTEVVLSINDDIYSLPAGDFKETVTLQEGPNVIQIVASDMSGNEIDQILTITYQP